MTSALGNKSNIDFTTPGVLIADSDQNFVESIIDKNAYDNYYVVEFYTPHDIREGIYSVNLDIKTQDYIDKNNILELCNDATSSNSTSIVSELNFGNKDKEFFGLLNKGTSLVEIDIEYRDNVVFIIGALVIRDSAFIKLNKSYYYPFRVIGNKGKVKINGAKKMIYNVKGII